MLDQNILSQLAQLKKDIHDSMDYAEGVVRGTSGKHGFVHLDDGRQAYLDPDTMQQLLPGDRIQVSCSKNEKKKWQAKLEKFISSDLKYCVGSYAIKGNNHFVEIDHPQLTRWLFVPPKFRRLGKKVLQQGDQVLCRISQHPYGHGKGQVKVVKYLGRLQDVGIERAYVVAKHGLRNDWSEQQQKQEQEILQKPIADLSADESLLSSRVDFTTIPFVTIDSESTLDMDDALYCERENDHWKLYVAIADPSAVIAADSPLDREAKKRAVSQYFPGFSVPMFPTELAQKYFSLMANEQRLALVCQMHIGFDGNIQQFELKNAVMKSRLKLSYQQVANLLDNNAPLLENSAETPVTAEDLEKIVAAIGELHKLAMARKQFRAQNNLVQEEKVDFYFKLNKQQKIEAIEKRQVTSAHRLVEEAMLATNLCAGEFLSKAGVPALFTAHLGFRQERLPDVNKLLQADLPDLELQDLSNIEDFKKLFRHLIEHTQGAPADNTQKILLEVLRRLLQPGEINEQPSAHYGMGIPQYAMITSPIRRYSDLHNHRVIKRILEGEVPQAIDSDICTNIKSAMQTGRQTLKELEHWLICQYLADKKDQCFAAQVGAVSNQGLGIRLLDNGIEYFIALRNNKKTPVKFNSQTMRMDFSGEHFFLGKEIQARLKHVNPARKEFSFAIEGLDNS